MRECRVGPAGATVTPLENEEEGGEKEERFGCRGLEESKTDIHDTKGRQGKLVGVATHPTAEEDPRRSRPASIFGVGKSGHGGRRRKRKGRLDPGGFLLPSEDE